MQVNKIETFKEWLLFKNFKLCNRRPQTENELDIKTLFEQITNNTIKDKKNDKKRKKFQTTNYRF